MLKLFTVYDSKTESYIQPFYELTTAAAVRAFTSAANSKNHAFNNNGSDYTLFEIGTFDQATAKLTPLDVPISLGLAINMHYRQDDPLNNPMQSPAPTPLHRSESTG